MENKKTYTIGCLANTPEQLASLYYSILNTHSSTADSIRISDVKNISNGFGVTVKESNQCYIFYGYVIENNKDSALKLSGRSFNFLMLAEGTIYDSVVLKYITFLLRNTP